MGQNPWGYSQYHVCGLVIVELVRLDMYTSMKEDKGQLHFYPTVLNNSQVQDFVTGLLISHESRMQTLEQFTLTVFRPEESGTLNGWRIEEVKVPGRYSSCPVRFR